MATSAKESVKDEEDSPENAFSFTRLLTNGDCWQGILEGHPPAAVSSEIQTTVPVVLPQSSEAAVNPSASEQDLVSTPPSTVDKSRKRRPTKDLSCITASQQTKNTEGGEEKPSKKQKGGRAARDRKQKEQSTSENTETTGSKPGKENSKPTSDAPKQDYIHVRARRGQATDSHSLAERVRREKISARMKKLQDLVPGCNKVTGKAMMLDEIINYVQSLQRQVEFLSMKLAAVKPALSLYTDTYLTNEAPALGGVHEMNCFNELLHDSEEAQWQTATGSQHTSVQLLSS